MLLPANSVHTSREELDGVKEAEQKWKLQERTEGWEAISNLEGGK